MHPSQWAERRPDHPATIMAGDGAGVTYGTLNAQSNRGAQLFRRLGLSAGDTIALWSDNRAEFLTVCWAAERAGLAFTPISNRLTAAEAEYIVRDCGARVLVVAPAIGDQAAALVEQLKRDGDRAPKIFALAGDLPGVERWETATAALPATPIDDESPGRPMLYSSGTTGRPKGVAHAPREASIRDEHPYEAWHREFYGFDEHSVFLSPAPLYHAAPLVFCLAEQRIGATVVLMEKFDAEALLAAIERHRITHTQLVPTMFVRLLRLPAEVRAKYDLSSLKVVVHAGSPCAPDVKRGMIDWLGPIIYEYYSGTEGFGRTCITSAEWLEHPGSVGRAVHGVLHICDEAGSELGPGETGQVYFESDLPFSYHGDPDKTAAAGAPNNPGWRTYGDIGHLDADGYLFLSDRKAFMIISGGVNIYPQEAENLLLGHPAVADVAVFGVPDADMGEAVKAVVQPLDWSQAGPELERALIAWCRERLAHYKCPKSIDFDPALPRHSTGKLYKKELRDRYWREAGR
jgi:long-chain acyl-CoA synthetase